MLKKLDAGRVSVAFLVLLPVFAAFRLPVRDPDLWWHLAQGRWILEHGEVPWTDVFSYTAAGHPWIAYSWLAEVLFRGIETRAGFGGLVALQAMVTAALVGFLYRAARAAGAGRRAAIVTTLAASLATSFTWAVRPVIFSLLFLTILVRMVAGERTPRSVVWMAPAIVAVWANVHVLFVVGVALLGWAALCRRLEGRPAGALALATALSALASLANPYGFALWETVGVMGRQPALAPWIEEFVAPSFHGQLGLTFAVWVLGSLAVVASSRERLTLFELGIFAGSLAVGLAMTRNMALFAILTAPVVARRVGELWPETPARVPPPRSLAAVNALVLAAAIGAAIASFPRSPAWQDHVEPGSVPSAAADYVAAHHRGARLFNDFDWGGFLIYRLWPAFSVSIDGRTQVYGEEILRAYGRTHYVRSGWRELLDACDPDVILWPAAGPFAMLVRELPGWRVAYEDEIAVVFVRTSPTRSLASPN